MFWVWYWRWLSWWFPSKREEEKPVLDEKKPVLPVAHRSSS
jgi:hypothetical protein